MLARWLFLISQLSTSVLSQRNADFESLRLHISYGDLFDIDKDFLKSYIVPPIQGYLESALHVKRFTYNLILGSSTCGSSTIPADLRSSGVSADFVIFLESHIGSSTEFLATSTLCEFQSSSPQNPLSAQVLINSERYNLYTDNDQRINNLLHAFIHALGFSETALSHFHKPDGSVYALNEVKSQETIRGVSKDFIITPEVLSRAQSYFDCSSMIGLELEEEACDCPDIHWDKRVAYGSLMTCGFPNESIISHFTFAFFQDSGWYDVQWSYAQTPIFGKSRGCDFLNLSCLDSESPRFPEFCGEGEGSCGPLKLYKSYFCGVTNYTSVPIEFQYFSDPTKGGEDKYIDYCPVAGSGSLIYCSSGQPLGSNIYGETYGENSRCFTTNLVLEDEVPLQHSGCYRVSCGSTTYTISVSTSDSTITADCSGTITFEGFAGEFVCPPRDEVCHEVPCDRLCSGQGVCENSQCNCNDYRGGDDCSIVCSSLCVSCNGPENYECTECAANAFLAETTCLCNDYYNFDGSICCFKNCSECSPTDGNTCLSCITGLDFVDGACQCPEDYIFNADFECERRCPEGCSDCDRNDRTICTKCENNRCLLMEKCYFYERYSVNEEGDRICAIREFGERLVFTLVLFLLY